MFINKAMGTKNRWRTKPAERELHIYQKFFGTVMYVYGGTMMSGNNNINPVRHQVFIYRRTTK